MRPSVPTPSIVTLQILMGVTCAILADFTENFERIRNEKSSEYPSNQGGEISKRLLGRNIGCKDNNPLMGFNRVYFPLMIVALKSRSTALYRRNPPLYRTLFSAIIAMHTMNLYITQVRCVEFGIRFINYLKKNQNAPRPSEHPPVRGKKCQNV